LVDQICHRIQGHDPGVLTALAAHLATVFVKGQDFHAMALQQFSPMKAHLADAQDADFLKSHEIPPCHSPADTSRPCFGALYAKNKRVFKAVEVVGKRLTELEIPGSERIPDLID
jgi:hypothetical protein